jgi:Family of unknown function (DUF6155)
MGIKELKKELKKLDQANLIDLIIDLYQKNKPVMEQLDFRFNPNETELVKSYKKKVLEAFYPKRGDQFHLKIGKQAISDFRKLKTKPDSLADLMIYYVECGVRLTREYGDIDENFYSSLESVYQDVMKLIAINDLYEKFEDRAFKIVEDTKNIGWGFHDFLGDEYGQTYG